MQNCAAFTVSSNWPLKYEQNLCLPPANKILFLELTKQIEDMHTLSMLLAEPGAVHRPVRIHAMTAAHCLSDAMLAQN